MLAKWIATWIECARALPVVLPLAWRNLGYRWRTFRQRRVMLSTQLRQFRRAEMIRPRDISGRG